MDFSCSDLAARGVELTASDSNLRATLKNKSDRPIAGYAVAWTWESIGGARGGLISRVWEPQLLIPSLVCAKTLLMIRYRSTILPGSSRRLSPGVVDGDNRDVCLPMRDEVHEGGWISIANRTPVDVPGDIRTASLTMDGVMFLDGEFIGPNKTGLWDEIQHQSRIRLRLAEIAQAGVERGLPPRETVAELAEFVGAPEPTRAHKDLANWYKIAHSHHEPEGLIELLALWLKAPVPILRRTL